MLIGGGGGDLLDGGAGVDRLNGGTGGDVCWWGERHVGCETRRPAADLSLTKTTSDAAPYQSDEITFAVTVGNAGPDGASSVEVMDLLPTGLTYRSHVGVGTYNQTTGAWDVGSVPAGAFRTLRVRVSVDGIGALTNTASVEASDTWDPDSTPGDGPGTEDDEAAAVVSSSRRPVDVSGILSVDTTWTEAGGPYRIVDTVQIPSGVTLSIQAGARVTNVGGYAFLLQGALEIQGTATAPVWFEGGGGILFTPAPTGSPTATIEYAHLQNFNGLWYPDLSVTKFALLHSTVVNVTEYQALRATNGNDFHIEYNRFVDAHGIAVSSLLDAVAYIRWNRFESKGDMGFPFWVLLRGTGLEGTLIQYNCFLDAGDPAIRGFDGGASGLADARFNYWGTTDSDVIRAMIFDREDSILAPGYIPYVPFLTVPDPTCATAGVP